MKYLNRLTRTMVDFKPGQDPVPVFFIHEGRIVRVDRVVSKTRIRRTFDQCILYKCEAARQMVELRWDRDKDRWFIEKIGE